MKKSHNKERTQRQSWEENPNRILGGDISHPSKIKEIDQRRKNILLGIKINENKNINKSMSTLPRHIDCCVFFYCPDNINLCYVGGFNKKQFPAHRL